jgi:small subunit ribosomal protein S6
MNKYELVYIIDPAVEEEARKALMERVNGLITGNAGEVSKVEEWGKRRLAYAINYKTEGWYVLVNFTSASELPREIERNLGNIDSVIRYQIVRVLDKRSNVKPRAVRTAPAAEAAEAPAAEEPAEAPVE